MKKPLEQTPYVFVYGTLMSGFGNNGLLSRAEFIGTATTEDNYKMLAKGIPYLIEEKGESYVSGEIYRVSENALSRLDQLEGHPSWYCRKVITVINEMGDKVKVWVYFMPKGREQGVVVESGNYRDYAVSSLV